MPDKSAQKVLVIAWTTVVEDNIAFCKWPKNKAAIWQWPNQINKRLSQMGQPLVAVENKVGAVNETKRSGHDSIIISNNSPTLDHSMYTFLIKSMK
jgi:hypothetical protein